MCTVMLAVGAGLTAMGTAVQMSANFAQANYARGLAAQQAATMRQQANYRLQVTDFEASRKRMQNAWEEDKEELRLAAAGLNVGAGSAAGALTNKALSSLLDLEVMNANQDFEQWQMENRAIGIETQGEFQARANENNAWASFILGGTKLALQGAFALDEFGLPGGGGGTGPFNATLSSADLTPPGASPSFFGVPLATGFGGQPSPFALSLGGF